MGSLPEDLFFVLVRRLLVNLLLFYGVLISSVRAEMTHWAIGTGSSTAGFPVMSIDPISGSTTTHGFIKKLDPNTWLDPTDLFSAPSQVFVDETNGDLYMRFYNFSTLETYKYDKDTNTITEATWWEDAYTYTLKKPTVYKNSDGSVSLKYGDTLLIERKDNGELHIGENSLITLEEDGIQKLYAKDANGNAIPIDVTEGSDLLVNGVSVMGRINENSHDIEINQKNIATNTNNIEINRKNIATNTNNIEINRQDIAVNVDKIETNRKNINDLGFGVAGATALTAALSSLPIAAENSPFSCGFGSGGYSSRFALGIGCASRLSDRLSVNFGGSHVFGGSSSYGGGSLDTFVARAGMMFKLGTIHQSSDKKVEELKVQIDELKKKSADIMERLERENNELLLRLERLEETTVAKTSASDVATR